MSAIRDALGLSQIGAVLVREAPEGLPVEIAAMLIRDASGLFEVFSSASGAFTVDVTPDSYGIRFSDVPGPVTTSEVTATPSGGRAPYTYLWQRADAAPEAWSILSPTSASTTFRANSMAPGETFYAAFTCTVTDANGTVVVSIEVPATASAYSFGGPIP